MSGFNGIVKVIELKIWGGSTWCGPYSEGLFTNRLAAEQHFKKLQREADKKKEYLGTPSYKERTVHDEIERRSK